LNRREEARGFFGSSIAPTAAEEFFCSGEEGRDGRDPTAAGYDDDDVGGGNEEKSLIEGQRLRSSTRDWVFDESRSMLENRRALFHSAWSGCMPSKEYLGGSLWMGSAIHPLAEPRTWEGT
jgi:hypothetical protein